MTPTPLHNKTPMICLHATLEEVSTSGLECLDDDAEEHHKFREVP
jgi:hypothetical protein